MTTYYTAKDGTKYPVEEAQYDSAVTIRRDHYKKGIIGDPFNCAISNGFKAQRNVIEAFVGSGQVAYVVYGATPDKPAHAVRFKIKAQPSRVRDGFDLDKKLNSQTVFLGAVNPAASLAKTAADAKRRANGKGKKRRGEKAGRSRQPAPTYRGRKAHVASYRQRRVAEAGGKKCRSGAGPQASAKDARAYGPVRTGLSRRRGESGCAFVSLG